MAKRKGLSKRTRFEIFKRDSFTCQYCGRQSPDVVLQVDHIQPVAKGGGNDFLNLITSCLECNSGKSDRVLSDASVVSKQREQLAELQQRREQLAMLMEWHKGLHDLDAQCNEELASFWADQFNGVNCLSQAGMKTLAALRKKFSIGEIMEAMTIAVQQYVEWDGDEPDFASCNRAWSKVGGICRNRRTGVGDDEQSRRLYYIRGILRNRVYCNEQVAIQLLRAVHAVGVSLDELEHHAKVVKNWTEWREDMQGYLDCAQADNQEDPDF